MNWTEEQKKVISARGRNILVSAAAGSGKTAVLVERIAEMVSDPVDPVDVDRLLVLTFTRAAAAEMRSRLQEILRERAEADPLNTHLRRQLTLVRSAQISTIDSFCGFVVRNFFYEIGLDPAYRIADENECALMRADAIADVLEEAYREGREEFLYFTEALATDKNDQSLAKIVEDLFGFCMSTADPDAWLSHCLEAYEADPENAEWFREYESRIRRDLSAALPAYDQALALCADVPELVKPYAQYGEERDEIAAALSAPDYDGLVQSVRTALENTKSKPRASSKWPEEIRERDAEAGALRQAARDRLKGRLTPLDKIREDLRALGPEVRELVTLTRAFMKRFSEIKRKKGVLDFNDQEHFALQILYGPDGRPGPVADLLSERFEEIVIDEYQDSNFLQERILNAVSRERFGHPNVFMVGDMKQSIYRFRQARMELFLQKHDTYKEDDPSYQKIELHSNFRSREEVVNSVNFVFSQIMRREIGGVEYDAGASLRYDAGYRVPEDPDIDYGTEYLLYDASDPEEGECRDGDQNPAAGADAPEPATSPSAPPDGAAAPESDEDVGKKQGEAEMIAEKILALTDPEHGLLLQDGDGFRTARYGDIVILMRALTDADLFAEVLEDAGIPTYRESKTGFYDSREIRLVLDFLKVLDNPMDDIPLAAVLSSVLFSFTANELARIRALSPDRGTPGGFYGALTAFPERSASEGARTSQDEALSRKIVGFLETVEKYRKRAQTRSLSLLLRGILQDFGLLSAAGAMNGGARRMANLNTLVRKAADFEKTSYHGIFSFIRYIARMRENEMDEGESGTDGETGNCVRIMTIHKSKGLQFPIVFLARCDKKHNFRDQQGAVIFHPDHGVGMRFADPIRRVRHDTVIRVAFARQGREDAEGEELRLLYVAMTRAKEKLILTGTADDFGKLRAEHEKRWEEAPKMLDVSAVEDADSYQELVLSAYRPDGPIRLSVLQRRDVRIPRAENALRERIALSGIWERLTEQPGEEAAAEVAEVFGYDYHIDDLYRVRASVSVSALKEASHAPEEDAEAAYPRESLVDDAAPERITGAARGTLYHEAMERADGRADIREQLERWAREGLISEEEKDTIDPAAVQSFFESGIGQRSLQAADRGQRRREQQFIIGVPVRDVYPDVRLRPGSDDLVMIQGVIDLYFEEEDGLVLVDYKTDRVKTEEELKDRYKIQLDLYERALTQITGKPVKERWIWSFALNKEIRV